ncbi:MAG: hypothetical protein P9M03_07860 [Candidatus Theseobacter exili]|nr:hypothetical protein [Candidatus Theseobacter exili]
MYEGRIIARLIDKNTGKVKKEIDIANQISDEAFDVYFCYGYEGRSGAFNFDALYITLGNDSEDVVPANDPKIGYSDISSYILESKKISKTEAGENLLEYRCLYPTTSFAPPVADRSINLMALWLTWDQSSWSPTQSLIGYKKLTEPIVQTTSDYLEVIYALSAGVV